MLTIRQSFDDRFTNKLNEIQAKYGTEMLELDGIGPSKMDINQFAKDFFKNQEAVSDVTVDANANVSDKSVLFFENEYGKALHRLNTYYILWKKMVEDSNYGIKRANKILEACITGALKIHDQHYFMRPYCYGFTLAPLIQTGLPFIDKIKIGPPKHFKSFINLIIQFTAFASNQLAGASAYPDIFVYMDWFARKDFGENYHEDPKTVENIKQELQSLIYSFNWPFRGGAQSPFTNISVFDHYFLEYLFGNIIYPDLTKPKLESIKKLQELYMRWFVDESKKQLFTFPVNTVTFYKENDKIKDEAFLKLVSELNCYNGCFNIYAGDISSISSCCFNGDEVICIKNNITNTNELIKIKDFVDKFVKNQEGEQKIDNMYSIMSYDVKNNIEEPTLITGVLKKPNIVKEMIKITIGEHIIEVTLDHVFNVFDKTTNEIKELKAEDLIKDKNRYKIAVV